MEKDKKEDVVMRQLNVENEGIPPKKVLIICLVVIAAGVVSGFGASFIKKLVSSAGGVSQTRVVKKAVGILDKKTFKDSAEGTLREGGIEGEGQFHLERPGGESQNVYLTSTTVDLSAYIGQKIRVWGETFSGEKAGWLMDVGLVEVL
ncbi:MAG TPA: hypothetical protein VJH96_02650 [Patescibacteria group bacterium]|nr:hypothetical protein [Patescibacteria group bacterium]